MFRRHHSPVRLRRPVRGGVLHQLHARMNRLPAHLTSEDDWKQDQPGVRLSRVFGVVLGIHVVAIGGLMAYEMFRHREPVTPNTAAMRSAAREARPAPGAASTAPQAIDAFADDPLHDGMKKHVVRSGERPSEIAALYGVDEKALLVMNRIGDGRAFRSGMKLVIPNNQLTAAAPTPPDRLLAASTPLAPTTATGAEAATADGLVPVTPAPFDPSLEVRRAEPVGDSLVEVTPKKPAAPAKPASRPSTKPVPVVSATKKPAATTAKKSATAATKPKPKGRVHVVKNGENAYRIAKAYGVNVDQLIKTNGINPGALRPGTALTIPAAR